MDDNEVMMQVVTFPQPEPALSVRRLDREKFSDHDYWEFCQANPNLRIERTAEGEITIVPPAGGESDYQSTQVIIQLGRWAEDEGHGKAFGMSVQFLLPDGSGMSPDAAWVSNDSLTRLSKQERKKFLRLSPEFIVEVLSPTDRLKAAKTKMELWIANGVQLGWLIDADAKTVYVYRQNRSVRIRRNISELAGEGPVQGFVLKLERIWKGL